MIDIHTHSLKENSKIKKHFNFIFNNYVDEQDINSEILNYPYCSLGIHPWYIAESSISSQLIEMRDLAKHPNVKFIGEAGLDKLKGPDFRIQEDVFIKQIRIAEEFRKPVIIHCVKSYGELLSIKKLLKPKANMLIHGFNKHLELAKQLIDNGFYLSFGEALLKSDKVKEVLKGIDLEKIFFETDDSDLEIEIIYKTAADLLNMELLDLENKINDNYIEFTI